MPKTSVLRGLAGYRVSQIKLPTFAANDKSVEGGGRGAKKSALRGLGGYRRSQNSQINLLTFAVNDNSVKVLIFSNN